MSPGEQVSLRHHLYVVLGCVVAAFLLVLREKDKALGTALAANDRRLEGMNEFRGQLKDAQGTYVTRDEASANRARATATAVAVVGIVVAAAALLIPLSR